MGADGGTNTERCTGIVDSGSRASVECLDGTAEGSGMTVATRVGGSGLVSTELWTGTTGLVSDAMSLIGRELTSGMGCIVLG